MRHDLELNSEIDRDAYINNIGKTAWERKIIEANQQQRKDIVRRERTFCDRNKDKVKIISKLGPKKLGLDQCVDCNTVLNTSIYGLERHVEKHEYQHVTRIYFNECKNTFHPSEQYYASSGSFRPAPGSKLHRFVINKVHYEEGSEWECENCNISRKWNLDITGQKVNRIINYIEEHIDHLITYGNCEPNANLVTTTVDDESQNNPSRDDIVGNDVIEIGNN
jgi:hypothetical protein